MCSSQFGRALWIVLFSLAIPGKLSLTWALTQGTGPGQLVLCINVTKLKDAQFAGKMLLGVVCVLNLYTEKSLSFSGHHAIP
jgi:hypothetical protein